MPETVEEDTLGSFLAVRSETYEMILLQDCVYMLYMQRF